MVASVRAAYNAAFTKEKYQEFLNALDACYPSVIDFRIAETPVFVDRAFTNKMMNACEHIIDLIKDDSFLALTENAIPPQERVAGKEVFPR